MSKLKEKSEYMAMRVSGLLGWIHRIVMFVTFPIRKFWLLVSVAALILVIIIAIPLFYGIRFGEIWDWYMVKMPTHEFIEAKDKTIFDVENNFNKIKRTFKEIVPDKNTKTAKNSEDKKSKVDFVSWNVAEFRRAKYKPQKPIAAVKKAEEVEEKVQETENVIEENAQDVDIEIKEISVDNNVNIVEPPIEIEPLIHDNAREATIDIKQAEAIASDIAEDKTINNIGNLDDYYVKLRRRDLAYLNAPEIFKGNAEIIGANSLYVDGKFMFLYGIYSHPRRHDLTAASKYLKNITAGKEVVCAVVAYYDKNNSATALCFVDGIFINKALTEHNLAKNVAIK